MAEPGCFAPDDAGLAAAVAVVAAPAGIAAPVGLAAVAAAAAAVGFAADADDDPDAAEPVFAGGPDFLLPLPVSSAAAAAAAEAAGAGDVAAEDAESPVAIVGVDLRVKNDAMVSMTDVDDAGAASALALGGAGDARAEPFGVLLPGTARRPPASAAAAPGTDRLDELCFGVGVLRELTLPDPVAAFAAAAAGVAAVRASFFCAGAAVAGDDLPLPVLALLADAARFRTTPPAAAEDAAAAAAGVSFLSAVAAVLPVPVPVLLADAARFRATPVAATSGLP